MTTYTDYIGSVAGGNARDGDYATIELWIETSGNFQHPGITDGDTLEAVLIDGPHALTQPSPSLSNTRDYTVLIRGENSHGGYWSGAPLSGEPGACVTLAGNNSWNGFGDQNVNLIFRDFVLSSLGGTFYLGNLNATSGDSGQYDTLVEFDRVMFQHDEAYATSLSSTPWQIATFLAVYLGNESRNPDGEVSALGQWTFNFKNCVIEVAGSNLLRQFKSTNPQQVELEINYIGTTFHTNNNLTTGAWRLNAQDNITQRTSGAPDSVLRCNMSGCIFDKHPFHRDDIGRYWAGADKTINITDSFIEQTEASFNTGLDDSLSATQAGFSAFSRTYSNVNFNTNITYTGASASNSVSYVKDSQYAYAGDYRQVDGSLAIDYVTNATMPSVDVTNTSRGTSPFTAGAYEFIAATTDVTINFGNTYIRVY